jgi:hypothetical protein
MPGRIIAAMHRVPRTAILGAMAALSCLAAPSSARAGEFTHEVWAAGGFNNSDYAEDIRACLRGGVGAIFEDRVGLGASFQVDRDRWYYFGYASVFLPKFGMFEPYARLHIGQRDDVDETAYGWTAGLRMGDSGVYLFLEAHGIRQPGYSDGASFGICF